ncbi:hypothetical protein HK104_006071 [Borealophlyctis nickersoniae]|nr:hypothetical protein HK104_006071 [Borealophlyctis nickersoniae]
MGGMDVFNILAEPAVVLNKLNHIQNANTAFLRELGQCACPDGKTSFVDEFVHADHVAAVTSALANFRQPSNGPSSSLNHEGGGEPTPKPIRLRFRTFRALAIRTTVIYEWTITQSPGAGCLLLVGRSAEWECLDAHQAAVPRTTPLPSDELSSLFEQYKSYISHSDQKYFNLYDVEDQQRIIDEAKRRHVGVNHLVSAYESEIVGIAIARPDGVIVEANSKCLSYIGKTREDLEGGRVHQGEFATEDANAASVALLEDVYIKKKLISYKKTFTDSDGKPFPVLIELRYIESAGRLVAYLIDVSSSIAAHDLVRQERGMFEQLADSVRFIVWTSTIDGRVDWMNDQWYEYTKAPRHIVTAEWSSFLHDEDRQKCLDRWQEAVKLGTPFEAEGRLADGSGQYRWHLMRASPSTDNSGNILRWYGTCIDVHDRKLALLRSENAENQFNALLNNLPIVAWGCDTNWICNMVKGKALGMKGLTETLKGMALGLRDTELIGTDMRSVTANDPNLRSWIERALAGETFGTSNHLTETDTWYETVYSPRRDESGRIDGMIAISIDVTDSKTKEEANRRAESAKQALQINTEFLANMSHEIRTPLNGIIGMADLILSDAISESHRPYMKLLKQSGKTLLHIVNEILDLSKLNAGKMQLENIELDLRNIVNTVVQTSQISMKSPAVTLLTTIDTSVPLVVRGDPTKIIQIITNLVNNAIKFTSTGSVTVHVSATDTACTTVAVRISVIDTGPGLSDDLKGNLFREYSQQDESIARKYGGTGLGLSICHKLAKLMGGKLEAESQRGQGSTFRVTLPLQRSVAPAVLAANRAESDQHLHIHSSTSQNDPPVPARILVAEDNPVNQIIIERMLSKLGVEADIVNNGCEVLRAVSETTYDLIFMDCNMPMMDGYDATRELRRLESHAKTPIIALTAGAMEANRVKCLEAGMNDFITKPLSMKVLADTLKKWLARSVWVAKLK